ncbi:MULTISPECIES: hypothetical protein [Candidatus Ichthyocystis]|uniref:hypothetical protein n=1 Tax=Candidatus Ichthyocystis TaxID=2929841 RepID=UPI000B8236C4|nr:MULTISPECIES: hypothetical protein [Ichthyocystis]
MKKKCYLRHSSDTKSKECFKRNSTTNYLPTIVGVVASYFLAGNIFAHAAPEWEYVDDGKIVDTTEYQEPDTREYTIDTRNNDTSYPRRWNPFSSGRCSEDSGTAGLLNVLHEDKKFSVGRSVEALGSIESFVLTSFSQEDAAEQPLWFFDAECSGRLNTLESREGPSYCLSMSKEIGLVELNLKTSSDSDKCEHFKYLPIRERGCSGALEGIYASSGDGSTKTSPHNYRLFKYLGNTGHIVYWDITQNLEEQSTIRIGDIFDFSYRGRHPYTSGVPVGFNCREKPMVNDALEHLGDQGEISFISCDKQPGCKWIRVDNIGLEVSGLPIQNEVMEKLGASELNVHTEVRNDAPLLFGRFHNHYWTLVQGSRIRTDSNLCLTSDKNGSNIAFEDCDNANSERFYIPVRMKFTNRTYNSKETTKNDIYIGACVSINKISREIENVKPKLDIATRIADDICKLPRNHYQKAKVSK